MPTTSQHNANDLPVAARALENPGQPGGVRFTVATLVNDMEQYREMLTSFQHHGFGGVDVEFIYIDNTSTNTACGYRGLERFLDNARGHYVIVCHQDVRLVDDGRDLLEQRLDELTGLDRHWAVAGNAGGIAPGRLAIRISDGHGANTRTGQFPQPVTSLDENFLVVHSTARVGPSCDLEGFHFYGADLCLQAALKGHTAYVIDFHLKHLSTGNKSGAFFACRSQLRDKYQFALRSRWIQTTCSLFYVSGSRLKHSLGECVSGLIERLARRLPDWIVMWRRRRPAGIDVDATVAVRPVALERG